MAAMPETYPCSGACGLKLDKPDSWCLSCSPKEDPIRPAAKAESGLTERQIRMQIWQASYKLALGSIKERPAALDTISHLVTVLQHMNQTKET